MDLVSIAIWGIVVFTLLGLFFGFALAATAKKFNVPMNPTVEKVRGELPSANCGACGYAGCQAYAEEVVENPGTSASLCVPGGKATAALIGELTGKALSEMVEKVAVVRCHGTTAYVADQADYLGIRSCNAASLVFGGPRACKNGCLGLGDCVRTCPFDAMKIGATGIVEINQETCTGCGLCLTACPKHILELYPRTHRVELSCVAREKSTAVRPKCLIGCITCRKCVSACPANAISWSGTTIVIDHEACVAYGAECKEVCVDVCPTYVMHRLGGTPVPESEKERLVALATPSSTDNTSPSAE